MANFLATTAYTRLMPIRDYDEHEVLQWFSKDVTGVAGELVKVVNNDLSNSDGWSNTSPGASFLGVTNLRYEVKSKVTATVGGETRDSGVVGFTLFPTLETDENGMPLKFNRQRQQELQAVLSGEAAPILTKGVVQLLSTAYTTPAGQGLPKVGWVGVPSLSGAGLVEFVNPAVSTLYGIGSGSKYNLQHRLGVVLGVASQGNTFSGAVLFKLEL